MSSPPRPMRSLARLVAALALAGCSTSVTATGSSGPASSDAAPPSTTGRVSTSTSTRPTTTTSPPTTSTSTTTSSTTTSSTTTSTTTTTAPAVSGPVGSYPTLEAAAHDLAIDNAAVAVSVRRVGDASFDFAAGLRADGRPATTDSPFVTASVSKLVTALSIARLVEQGRLVLTDPVPWEAMQLARDPAWDDVTVRELLAHTSGMPIARKSWLDEPGSCAIPLQAAMAAPPTISRGQWTYSNGNYCALGLLIEQITGMSLDEAAYDLVLTPAGIDGPYLTTEGLRPDSVPHAKGIERLDRLGGAGTWMASSDDIAAMLTAVTAADLETLQWPGIIIDQYGWGHTGTVDGAKACAWVLDEGRTVVVGIVSGSKPATGGKVCDRLLPALAIDLGIWAGDPIRTPD